jgi:hypothetical protein
MATRLNRQDSGADPAPELAPCDSHWHADSAWIETPFQTTVRGTSQSGERFRLDTILDRLSSSYLALRLPYLVEVGQPLFVFVRLVIPPQPNIARSGVAVRGVVVCADQRPGSVWRVTVELTRRRFLYASAV